MNYPTLVPTLVTLAGLFLLLPQANAEQGYWVDYNPTKRIPAPAPVNVGMDGVAPKAACVSSEAGVKVSDPAVVNRRRPIDAKQADSEITLTFEYEAKLTRELATSEDKPVKLRKKWWQLSDREFTSRCGSSYVQTEEGVLRKTARAILTFKSEADATDFFRALDEDDKGSPSSMIEDAVKASGARIEKVACAADAVRDASPGKDADSLEACMRVLDHDDDVALANGLNESTAEFIPLRAHMMPLPDLQLLKSRGPLE